MSLQPEPCLSFEDWLAGRSECLGGEVFAMTEGLRPKCGHSEVQRNDK